RGRNKGRKTLQPKSRRDEELKAGRSLNGVATPPRPWWATRRQRRAYMAAAKARERACRSPVVRRPSRKTTEKPDSGSRLFLGRWAEPSRPGIDTGSPERPPPVRSSSVRTPEPRSRRRSRL